MATIVNARDIALQATTPRLVSVTLPDNIIVPAVKSIVLTAPSLTFQVSALGTSSPASIVLTAALRQVAGTISFSVLTGTATLTSVTATTATLLYANMGTDSVTIRATVVESGTTYTSDVTLAKVRDGTNGAPGTRGTRQLYLTNAAYTASYGAANYAAAATSAIASATAGTTPTTPILGDTVTFTNGLTTTAGYTTTYTCTVAGASPTWALPGAVIDGNLLVTGTVTTTKLQAGLLDGFSLRVGTAATGVTVAGAAPVSNAAGANITNGTYIYQESTNLYGLFAKNAGSGGSAYFESGGGTTIDCFHNTGLSGAAGNFRSNSANTGSTGISVIGYHGARIANTGSTQVGLIGTAIGKCFYAETGTFGPFTGAHDALLRPNSPAVPGDIMVDFALKARKGISDTLFEVRLSSTPSQAAAVGVFVEALADWSGVVPASLVAGYEDTAPNGAAKEALPVRRPMAMAAMPALLAVYSLATVNAVGEGQINVCGEGGNLEAGDLIVTSSMPGKGMRQSDDIVRSVTVAKCREAVHFSGPGDVRLVACIYLCG